MVTFFCVWSSSCTFLSNNLQFLLTESGCTITREILESRSYVSCSPAFPALNLHSWCFLTGMFMQVIFRCKMKCLVLWSNNNLCQFAAWIKMHLCSLLGKYAAGCLLWVSCTSLKYGFLSCLFITHLYTWELSKFQLKTKTTGILYGWKMVCWLCPEQKRLRSHVGFGMQFWVQLGTNLWVKAGDLAVLFSGQFL